MFDKILVANRGEIAVRVLRTCRRLGIRTVAVYSDADARAPHVRLADEAVRLGPPPVKDSYLDADAIARAVRETGASGVHPGYGLLSENRAFAETVARAGAVFIGPSPEALEAFGDKIRARQVARSVGVSPPPGSEGPVDPADAEALAKAAESIGYPVLVKAAGGGGGIGMQAVSRAEDIERAARTCSDRGRAAFGDPRVYVERYLQRPRHIEVQVFRDRYGSAVAFGERECSVQRRHQKVVEESPSPASFFSGPEGVARRERLLADALKVLEKVGYLGAGTVEFVADATGELFFLEVNARLQVEHPVTEMVTGLDLVELQLRLASGEPLPSMDASTRPNGHAIEARVYAEDPARGFIPQPGVLTRLEWPEREGIRVDSGFEAGSEITPYYDPLIAKVISHGRDRTEAITRLKDALSACVLELTGPKGPRVTNVEFLLGILDAARFRQGDYDTGLVDSMRRSPS